MSYADISRLTMDQVAFEFVGRHVDTAANQDKDSIARAKGFATLDKLCQVERMTISALKAQSMFVTVTQLQSMGERRACIEYTDPLVSEYLAWKMAAR